MDNKTKTKKTYEPPEVKDIKPATVVDVTAKGDFDPSNFIDEE